MFLEFTQYLKKKYELSIYEKNNCATLTLTIELQLYSNKNILFNLIQISIT